MSSPNSHFLLPVEDGRDWPWVMKVGELVLPLTSSSTQVPARGHESKRTACCLLPATVGELTGATLASSP